MSGMDPEEGAGLGISARKQGAAVRAFFAVALSEETRQACAAVSDTLRRRPHGDAVRWVRPEGYHLTLRFLGNVATGLVEQLAAEAKSVVSGLAPFEVKLGAPLAFPSARRPRVVALPAEPEEALAELAGRLERAAVGCGLAPERRAFHGHLTLGRLRNQRMPRLEGAAGPEPGRVPVDAAVLFKSDLERDGARYSVLERCKLIGEGASAPSSTDLP